MFLYLFYFLCLINEYFILIYGIESNINELVYPVNSLYSVHNLFEISGNPPTKRVYQSIAVNKNEQYIVIFGGYSNNGDLLNDINMYSILTNQWSGPILRFVCCTYTSDPVDILGYNNDTIPKFIRYGFQGDLPIQRAEHTAVFIDNLMYIFGGITNEYSYVNDFYSFDIDSLYWTRITDTYSNINSRPGTPFKRAGHSMTKLNNTIYIFGGRTYRYNSIIGLNDIWSYNTVLNQWNILDTSSYKPNHRQYASITASESNNLIIIFGGIDPTNNITYNDIWLYNLLYNYWYELQSNSNDLSIGYAPPPLYSSYLFSIDSNEISSNITINIYFYGGVGGTGRCGGSNCKPIHLTIGQIYRYQMILNTWRYTLVAGNWIYTSITNSPAVYPYIKPYVYESTIYLPKSKLLIEFGGLESNQYISIDEQVVKLHSKTINLQTGGYLPNQLINLPSGLSLTSRIPTPVNNYWSYENDFIDQINNHSTIVYHQRLKISRLIDGIGLDLLQTIN